MFCLKGKINDLHAVSNIIADSAYGPMAFLFLPLDFDGKLETEKIQDHIIDSFISFDTRTIPSKFKIMSIVDLPNYESDYLIGIFPSVNPKISFEEFSKKYPKITKHLTDTSKEFEFLSINYFIDGIEQKETNSQLVDEEGNKKIVTGEGLEKLTLPIREEEQKDKPEDENSDKEKEENHE